MASRFRALTFEERCAGSKGSKSSEFSGKNLPTEKKSLHFPVLLRDSRSVSVPGGTMASRDGEEGNGALSEKEKESSCNA